MKRLVQIGRMMLTIIMLCVAFTAHSALSLTNSTTTRTDFSVNQRQVTPYNGSSFQFPIGKAPNLVTFNITVFRPLNSSDDGYVSIYSGSDGKNDNAELSPGAGTPGSGTATAGLWQDARDSRGNVIGQQASLGASFDTGRIPVGDVNIYAVLFSGSPGSATKVLISVPILIRNSTLSGSNPPDITTFTPTQVRAGSTFFLNIGGRNLSGLTSVSIGNTSSTSITYVASYPGQPVARVTIVAPPAGSYAVTATNATGSAATGTLTTYDVRPVTEFLPCSNVEICSDQCVTYNSKPAVINGRVLADGNSESFVYFENNYPDKHFASGDNYEWAQWQSSTDQNNWNDIPNATERAYQPGALTQTTYFRRVSSHQEGSFNKRTYWYTSNTVTITVGPPSPTPVQATYSTCANGNTVVAIRPTANAVSYNWWVPFQGWGVSNDGNNPYSTFNNNSSFVTTNTQVYIYVPSGVTPGNYTISFSANGSCGPKSADGTLTISIGSGSAPIGAIGDYQKITVGSGNDATTNLSIAPVTNATSYLATVDGSYSVSGYLSGSRIIFETGLPCSYYGQVMITASSSCNSTSRTSTVKTGYCPSNATMSTNSVGLYPNPAVDQVTIESFSQDATVFFHNAQGILQKRIALHAKDMQTSINTHDLPSGIYHVIVQTKTGTLLSKQLIIQH